MAQGYLLRAAPHAVPPRLPDPDPGSTRTRPQGSEVGAATAQEGEEDGAGGGSGGRGKTHEPRERRWAPGQSAVGTQGLEQTQQRDSSSGRSSPSQLKRKVRHGRAGEEEGCEKRAQAIARCYRRQHRRRAPRPAGGDQRGGSCRKGGGEQRRGAVRGAGGDSGVAERRGHVNELKATLEKQTVKQLKLELEKAGLDLKGKKSILVDRLAEHQLRDRRSSGRRQRRRSALWSSTGQALPSPPSPLSSHSLSTPSQASRRSSTARSSATTAAPAPYRPPSIRRRRSSRISTCAKRRRDGGSRQRRRWRMRSWRARGVEGAGAL